MIIPARVTVDKTEWDKLWCRYRFLINGTLELYIPNNLHVETIMRDFERLRGELETGESYLQYQISRLDRVLEDKVKRGLSPTGYPIRDSEW